MRLPRSLSGWTMAVFGFLAVALGVVGLVSPDTMLALLGFEVLQTRDPGDYTKVYLAASSMAAVNMGVYYLLAAAADYRPFFLWTVPFRLLTFTVFTLLVVTGAAPARFVGVGIWEGVGAVVTGAALWWEHRRPPSPDDGVSVTTAENPADSA
ncbi:hypothetical protein SAMN05216276_1006180 [Streptosporangium subroseum]|uniref:Uncharacterized protein n=1 Tax=Streptosporangium subroseum TaxID=106412 RepID=A0A239D1S9_9ACTN|nr:hypothetical protein [Streptosporangium subroseum]SNS25563.1 hypothetical protein SAMN05216276_1006180 [Streptosporangium subroseum]